MNLTVDKVMKLGILNRVKVFLDGVEVKKCVEADEECGFVVCLNVAAHKPPMDYIPKFRKEGVVKIVIGEEDV